MNRRKNIIPVAAGILIGSMLTTTTGAAVGYVKAKLSNQPIYLDGEPTAWKDGKLLASVALTIPAEYEPITGTFWPWRKSEITKHVHNTPFAHFYIEAWDYYVNGVFQYTRYCIVTL